MIRIDYDSINDLDTALRVIHKLVRGIDECPSATFSICPNCGAMTTDGYICWSCGFDDTDYIEEDENE